MFDEVVEVVELGLDGLFVADGAVTWDDGCVIVAEVEDGFEGFGPAYSGDSCGGIEEGVETGEDEVACVDDVFVFEVDDEVVVGVASTEVVHGDFCITYGDGLSFIGDAVLGGDVGAGPGV